MPNRELLDNAVRNGRTQQAIETMENETPTTNVPTPVNSDENTNNVETNEDVSKLKKGDM